MDDQALQIIIKLIPYFEKITESHSFLGIDYRIWPGLTVIVSLFIAFFVPYFSEKLRRRPRRTNLRITGELTIEQESLYVGRLIIRNNSNIRAMDVEAYVESIWDDGNIRTEFFPIPLKWTHGQINKSQILRNISGNQTVYLDIFDYKASDEIFRLATPIYVNNYCDLREGKTNLFIKIYQESGQVLTVMVTINWEKGLTPRITDQVFLN